VQTKVQTDFYCDKTQKRKHKRKKTRLWNKIVLQIGLEEIKGNGGSYFYLYPFGYLIQGSSQDSYHKHLRY
jgi:hypothetical protein